MSADDLRRGEVAARPPRPESFATLEVALEGIAGTRVEPWRMQVVVRDEADPAGGLWLTADAAGLARAGRLETGRRVVEARAGLGFQGGDLVVARADVALAPGRNVVRLAVPELHRLEITAARPGEVEVARLEPGRGRLAVGIARPRIAGETIRLYVPAGTYEAALTTLEEPAPVARRRVEVPRDASSRLE